VGSRARVAVPVRRVRRGAGGMAWWHAHGHGPWRVGVGVGVGRGRARGVPGAGSGGVQVGTGWRARGAALARWYSRPLRYTRRETEPGWWRDPPSSGPFARARESPVTDRAMLCPAAAATRATLLVLYYLSVTRKNTPARKTIVLLARFSGFLSSLGSATPWRVPLARAPQGYHRTPPDVVAPVCPASDRRPFWLRGCVGVAIRW
jgi:hypothetical protein